MKINQASQSHLSIRKKQNFKEQASIRKIAQIREESKFKAITLLNELKHQDVDLQDQQTALVFIKYLKVEIFGQLRRESLEEVLHHSLCIPLIKQSFFYFQRGSSEYKEALLELISQLIISKNTLFALKRLINLDSLLMNDTDKRCGELIYTFEILRALIRLDMINIKAILNNQLYLFQSVNSYHNPLAKSALQLAKSVCRLHHPKLKHLSFLVVRQLGLIHWDMNQELIDERLAFVRQFILSYPLDIDCLFNHSIISKIQYGLQYKSHQTINKSLELLEVLLPRGRTPQSIPQSILGKILLKVWDPTKFCAEINQRCLKVVKQLVIASPSTYQQLVQNEDFQLIANYFDKGPAVQEVALGLLNELACYFALFLIPHYPLIFSLKSKVYTSQNIKQHYRICETILDVMPHSEKQRELFQMYMQDLEELKSHMRRELSSHGLSRGDLMNNEKIEL